MHVRVCRKDDIFRQRRLNHSGVGGRKIAFRRVYPARAYTTLVVLVHMASCMVNISHGILNITLFKFHLAHVLHFIYCNLHIVVYPSHFTHCTLYIVLYTLHSKHCTLHFAPYTLNLTHCTVGVYIWTQPNGSTTTLFPVLKS